MNDVSFTCGNCGRSWNHHCTIHAIPCCPGKCTGTVPGPSGDDLPQVAEGPRTVPEFMRAAMEAAGINPASVAHAAAADHVIPTDVEEQLSQEAAAVPNRCATCRDPVDVHDLKVLHEITGWSRPRTQGGQNHVIDRKETGRLMCPACAARLIHLGGVGAEQETLPV